MAPISAGVDGEAVNRGDEVKLVPMRHKVTINEKLDDALDKSFPASLMAFIAIDQVQTTGTFGLIDNCIRNDGDGALSS